MLIGIAGPKSSGKDTFARWLKNEKQFSIIRLINQLESSEDAANKENRNSVSTRADKTPELSMTIEQLADFILEEQRWRDNYCVYPIENFQQLDQLRRRPFFWLVAIESPVLLRYRRNKTYSNVGLEDFLAYESFLPSGEEQNVFLPQRHADMLIVNSFDTIALFQRYCHKWFDEHLQLKQVSFLRPSWDDYFMLLADLAAYRSNCMKRRVGCILVKNYRVIATGYNGTPRGTLNCCDGGCKRCNDGAKCGQNLGECLCMHAEENALLEAGRERIGSDGQGVVLYCNTCPCLSCAKKIVQCGVQEVVYKQKYGMDDMTASLFQQVNLKLRQYHPKFQLHICSDTINDSTPILFNTDHRK